MNSLRDEFILNKDVIFLNHGSFGACPRFVFDSYQAWQRKLEEQPVAFLGRELNALLLDSRKALARYLNTKAENLVYIPNATHGINIIAASLGLKSGDEILTTDHEYGACEYAWEFWLAKSGAKLVKKHLPLPLPGSADLVELFWKGVNSRTKAIYLSHISSPTAMTFPVTDICARAKREGILTIIDGAHAPGQISVDPNQIGADFYTGNCHKWMLCPKGTAFLYAHPEVQNQIKPLVVSWGFHSTPTTTEGSQFIDYLQWTGTHDPSGALTVPSAIEFMRLHHWDQVRTACNSLLANALNRIAELTDLPSVYQTEYSYAQMAVAQLPDWVDLNTLKSVLYEEYRIEVPLTEWNGKKFIRISIQGYNTPDDVDKLVSALRLILKRPGKICARP